MRREVHGPRHHTALFQIPLVERDLLRRELLEFGLVARALDGEFVAQSLVLHGPPELELVLLSHPAVELGVIPHAKLLGSYLLRGGVVDGLQAPFVVDLLLIAAQTQVEITFRPSAAPAEPVRAGQGPAARLWRRPVVYGEPAGEEPRGLLHFCVEQGGYLPVAASDEGGGIDDLPGQLDRRGELERVVVARQRDDCSMGVDAHVHLVDRRVALRGRLTAARSYGGQVGVVLALARREDQGVVDTGQGLAANPKRESWRTVTTGSISGVCRSAGCCQSGGR